MSGSVTTFIPNTFYFSACVGLGLLVKPKVCRALVGLDCPKSGLETISPFKELTGYLGRNKGNFSNEK